MIAVRRLNHAVLFVSDLERAVTFYENVLGLAVVARERRANAAFLRARGSDNHHDLGLFGLGGGARRASRDHTGLYHLAWQVNTIEELVQSRDELLAVRAYHGESSHGATKSIYGFDPDANEFEVMWMLPREEWGAYESSAPIEPLDLAAEASRWAGVATAIQPAAGADKERT